MERKLYYRTEEPEAGMDISTFLKKRAGLTKKQISQAKFRTNGICVNGKRARVSQYLQKGDRVEILLECESTGSDHLLPCKGEISILYEDEDLMIVDKPAGMTAHPCGGHYRDSMANLLVKYFSDQGMAVRIRPVGRLDRETSGVLVFAKNQAAAGKLDRQKREGRFYKEYLALAEGPMEAAEGSIKSPIGKAEDGTIRMKVNPEGKRAVTRYQVRKSGMLSLLQVRIETGRTHQIRVHMASIGHPLAGDVLYGGHQDQIARTALHAWRVYLCQPFSGKSICVEAEIPADMRLL